MSDAADPLAPLNQRLEDLSRRLEPRERTGLARRINTDVAASNARRMKANVQPDGEPMTPRKPQASSKPSQLRDAAAASRAASKPGRMFQKAARKLVKRASPDAAEVKFAGATGRIMRVHQDGLVDRVSNEPDAPQVAYPRRQVLGLDAADRKQILIRVTQKLEARHQSS